MARKLLALGGVALALLIVSAVANPADARRGGNHFGGHRHFGHSHARPHFRPRAHFGHRPHFRHRHFRRHGRILLGAPLLYGGYYYYSGDCDWLRRRALYSGSLYWWDRYEACVYGYGD